MLPKRVTDIAIYFNPAPHSPFDGNQTGALVTSPNMLILRIQPDEGISMRFLSKHPGAGMKLRNVSMDFNYGASFGSARRRHTKRCWLTLCSVTRRYIHGRTWSRQVGPPSSPSLTIASAIHRISRTTPLVPGDRKPQTRCSPATAIHGGLRDGGRGPA